ncbi:Peptidyl-prolyl cis-trans isomerase pin4 [Friedmanniomyces endolithicus]|uniref:Peptidyl-prolyl cis-trans isomerase n=1 Tax=Friedmanniomyces endolithicus TaxID=329885 RepID=A0AAN6FI29_9PEZI|nr:Peptidyl-prolyl cis-trans isomerase pin4 [Friedmanniomyces endolithicus]KAK0300909.1 Peptidyl-prolyl cis-trans isomerase pin4 [Friedmanniomyces endolithicus]KAK0318813.1 Peptidyl-prolyl cis-trans isomerase pin4 [Friedmanniomyces endolithicus]KAK0986564.1 Peptidyl-prolyl cis-trans isomerase pin4 [Friedmanniomyces endolithicus]
MAPKPKDKSKAKEATTDKGGKAAKAAQQINVRHILCEKHGKKEEALAKLNSGASFDSVAREFSEDKARSGGSLGWKIKESLLPEFSAVAFVLAPSTTSSPKWGECKTSEGYHIMMVEGRK